MIRWTMLENDKLIVITVTLNAKLFPRFQYFHFQNLINFHFYDACQHKALLLKSFFPEASLY